MSAAPFHVKHPGGDELLAELVRLLASAGLNVTAARDERELWQRHIGDALDALPEIEAGPHGRIVDVGSGGGIPGLVLAIALPDSAVELVESVGRKAAFLAETADALGLENVVVHALRSEELAAGEGRDAFDLAVCRALAPPPVAAELCLPLVRAGGRWLLYAGEIDRAALDAACDRLAARVICERRVAGSERRRVVVAEKLAATPEGFPRRPGVAAKRPL